MPPVTVTSLLAKFVDGSLSVNDIVAVSPLLRDEVLLEMATVGATVSIEIDGEEYLLMNETEVLAVLG